MSVPLDLGTVPGVEAVPDGSPDGVSDAGVAYSSYDVRRRTRAGAYRRICNVTVYADGTVLVLHGVGSGAGDADYRCSDRVRDHLFARYEISPISPVPRYRFRALNV